MNGRDLWKDVFGGAAITIVGAVCCFGLFILLQVLSYWTPKDPIERHLRQAFEQGDLQLAYSLPYDSKRGYHQRNDCLIFWMAIIRPEKISRYLGAGQFVSDPAGRATYCETLRDHLMVDPTTGYEEENYLRYLHGYRTVTAFALSVLDVPGMRLLFKGLCYGLLAAVAVTTVLRLQLRANRLSLVARSRAWGGLGAAAAFASFYGLEYFGQSPSHAPAAWVLFLFLLIASCEDLLALSRWRFFVIMAVFGAFTAFFEYLTGAAVIGLALILGMMALQGGMTTPASFLFRRTVLAVCAYFGSMALTFAFNLALNVAYFGKRNLVNFFDALSYRMGSTAFVDPDGAGKTTVEVGLEEVVRGLVSKLDFLTFGDPVSAQLLFVFFACATVGIGLVGFIHSRSLQDVVRVLLVFSSVAVILLWVVAFKNHTLIHGAFMVRILVWIPAAAMLMAALVFGHLWSERPVLAHSRREAAVGAGA